MANFVSHGITNHYYHSQTSSHPSQLKYIYDMYDFRYKEVDGKIRKENLENTNMSDMSLAHSPPRSHERGESLQHRKQASRLLLQNCSPKVRTCQDNDRPFPEQFPKANQAATVPTRCHPVGDDHAKPQCCISFLPHCD